jgi:hypothetical protein
MGEVSRGWMEGIMECGGFVIFHKWFIDHSPKHLKKFVFSLSNNAISTVRFRDFIQGIVYTT